MSTVSKLLLLLLIVSMVCSCSAIRRETAVIDPLEKQDPDFGEYYISRWPTAKLSSLCIDVSNVTIGPWFVLPLPVIPNPLWPFHYAEYKKRAADMTLTIEARAKEHNWNNAHVEMLINDKVVPAGNTLDESTEWLIKRKYDYALGITCKELENSEITVRISDIPHTIESHLKYTYRFRVFADGP